MNQAIGRAMRALFMGSVTCLMLSGCLSEYLVFQQKTTLGVDVAPQPEGARLDLTVGYKRRTRAYVPAVLTCPASEEPAGNSGTTPNSGSAGAAPGSGGEETPERPNSAADGNECDSDLVKKRSAMSVLSFTKIIVSFWRLPQITEHFATGEAAVTLASKPDRVTALAESVNETGN